VRLAETEAQVFAAVGVHPNEASGFNAGALAELERLARHPRVKAIGEIGLDYYRDRTPRDQQQRVLCEQLELAATLGLPVVIHNRSAGEDVLEILRGWVKELHAAGSPLASRPGVLHSYTEGLEVAQQAVEAGFLVGFTGPVTFRNAAALQEVARGLPLESILVETDAPFLAPHPHRGKRNEPALVELTARKIAELHQVDYSSAAAQTTSNAARLFQW
jgi:TatD DNase family protein